MTSSEQQMVPVDFSSPDEAERAARIGRAWIEIRRGSWTHPIREHLAGDGPLIEPGQMDALDLLARRERTMTQLAERLRIDPSTATRAVQRLVSDGLAERTTALADGRVVIVRISDAGRAHHAAVDRRRTAWMAMLLSEFDASEREQLADLLDRFVSALDRSVAAISDS